ncbi:MAG: hypothetical protein NTV33_06940 [Coprothermobacterota bacterium]|nr:hypothetical protein [Coprothermobacterota bacterium]
MTETVPEIVGFPGTAASQCGKTPCRGLFCVLFLGWDRGAPVRHPQ